MLDVAHKTFEAPRRQVGASRIRSGERDASKENIVIIVPLDPASPALGGTGHLPAKNPLRKGLEAHPPAFSIQHGCLLARLPGLCSINGGREWKMCPRPKQFLSPVSQKFQEMPYR
jgi:hypothetical protein